MLHRLIAAVSVSAAFGVALPANAASTSDPVLASTHGGETLARRNRFLPWHPVERGRPLPADSELRCSADCTVRTADGSTLTLDPGTHIAVGQTTFVPMGGAFAALGRRFELLEGSVTADVASDPKRLRTIVVGTPNEGVVAVRPGQAQIVAGTDRAGVACLRGGARVKLGKTTLDLRAGEAVSFSDPETPLAMHALDMGPAWRPPSGKLDDPQPLALALGDHAAAPALAWEPVKGASGYRIEIANEPEFTKVVQTARLGSQQHLFLAKNLSQGTYFARVIAIDADGVASRPSATAAVRVVSVQVPVGGYADGENGTVIAPVGTSLRVSDSTKLEMAVDDHKFSPAASEWVADGVRHVVRFRLQGDFGRESRVVVEPRSLKADVRVGPAAARWPEDAIDIAVDIQDASGRFDPNSVRPELEVLIGTEPVAVDWKREGSKLTARLAPRTVTGPEVVRVIVRDQNGALLGRNFLEIEPSLEAVRHDKQLAKQ
jgi:hypothetical protein